MSEHDTQVLFDRVQTGEEAAAQELCDRYLLRLMGLAQARLSQKLAQKVDPEDIVQSALRSFFIRARDGQYAIERAGDLWRLLASITRHKLLKQAERFAQQKRSLQGEVPQALMESDTDESALLHEPTDEEALALSEELEWLMAQQDPLQRTVLEMRLLGQPIPEIADHIERSERTVRRLLNGFRDELEQRLQGLQAT